ncbi:Asp-tRNA(Asn)/Glu-tRNA(Gln) amidotransferase subunit GatA [candidate division KSB1 bacterium]|nr:Asp-tRNA(Asn)/Glu-tRNA(Gln) amidotransferase subunit GatA [candidate division KSB1 bacterium]
MPTPLPSHAQLRSHPAAIPEAVETSLRLARAGAHLNAFIHLLEERARRQAVEVRDALLRGDDLPLGGWLIAVKDNIAIRGTRLTCASRILDGFESIFTATAIERLERAGAILIGKTNLDEFAMGSSTENSAFGAARHPRCPECVPGGSSGGSAIAVSAGWVHAGLGSDTGGSVRQPAAFCGVVGLKPTYGRVSRYGLVAFGSSLDQISPFTSTCADAQLILREMAGVDERDSSSSPEPVDRDQIHATEVGPRLRVGLAREYFSDALNSEIGARIREVVHQLRERGHTVTEVSLPHTEYAIPVYYILATAEASSNLARFDGVRYGFRHADGGTLLDLYERTRGAGFGPEVRRRIMMGTYVLSEGYYDAYYKKAQRVRRLIVDDFKRAFADVDVVISPTTPTTAFKIGERADDPVAMYLSDVFTVPTNLAGIPAVSVPVGEDSQGLPIGLQIQGPHFAERRILTLGAEIEALGWGAA